MTQDEPDVLFRELSNTGRWSADDERGTLNHITPQKVLDAIGSVRSGRVVSVGRDLDPVPSAANPRLLVHRMLNTGYEAQSAGDAVEIAPHGFSVTHLDAVSHVYFRGAVYNGRRAADVVTPQGVSFGSIMAMRDGIVTRGILLDVAASRQVEYLEDEDVVSAADLDSAEQLAGGRRGTGRRGAGCAAAEPSAKNGTKRWSRADAPVSTSTPYAGSNGVR